MNEISCELCMDLIPLVRDGVASGDSVKAVEAHIASCESCREAFCGEVPPQINAARSLEALRRKVQFSASMLLMLGIFFGLSLTAGSDMFYNILLMPVIGALGYGIFRKKALYLLPLLLLATHFATNLFNLLRGVEHLDPWSVLVWTFLYSIFAVLGTVVAWLLHFAFRKER